MGHRRHRHPRQPGRRRGAGRLGREKGGDGGEFPEPADHAPGSGRGGLGTKLHLIRGGGVPPAADLTAGQRHESTRREPLAQQVSDEWPDVLPQKPAGDKAHSAGRIREWLAERWIEPVIARQKAERAPGDEGDFDRDTCRRRHGVECCIGWLKGCRALATRFEELAVKFLGTIRLAIILRYLRFLSIR